MFAAIPVLALVAACSGDKKEEGAKTSSVKSEPAKAAADKPAKSGKQQITIKGSDTMVHLVSAWSEAFMKGHPDSMISVTGGGSGTGIAALLNGTTDICASSRNIEAKETALAAQKGITPKEFGVARDGIAIIVHPSNPIAEVTQEQLMKIYTGAYTNWNQVGGPDQAIIALSRESSSGTYVFFQEHVLKKADYAPGVRLLAATAAIIQSAGDDKSSIGYAGLGYAVEAKEKVKILKVKANDTAPAIMPSDTTVRSGEYPIARALFFYVNGEPKGEVKDFIDFCLGEAGQKIVTENGYVTLK